MSISTCKNTAVLLLLLSGVEGDEPVDVAPALRGPVPVALPRRRRHAEAVAVQTLPRLAPRRPPAAPKGSKGFNGFRVYEVHAVHW